MAEYVLDAFGYTRPPRRGRDAEGLSTTQRRTRRQRADLALGRHPATGARLLDRPDAEDRWGYTCRDCAHSFRYRPGNVTVWKCAISFKLARGSSEATDIRVSWPACTLLRIEAAA